MNCRRLLSAATIEQYSRVKRLFMLDTPGTNNRPRRSFRYRLHLSKLTLSLDNQLKTVHLITLVPWESEIYVQDLRFGLAG